MDYTDADGVHYNLFQLHAREDVQQDARRAAHKVAEEHFGTKTPELHRLVNNVLDAFLETFRDKGMDAAEAARVHEVQEAFDGYLERVPEDDDRWARYLPKDQHPPQVRQAAGIIYRCLDEAKARGYNDRSEAAFTAEALSTCLFLDDPRLK